MSGMKFKGLAILVVAALCAGCVQTNVKECWWDKEEAWYDNGQEIDPDFVDVFYLYSTDVYSAVDEEGNTVYIAQLTDSDRELLDYELHSSNTKIFPDSLNFIAPYYHQYTIEALDLPLCDLETVIDEVESEVLEAFDYYMEHINGGRRFIVAGFSQGASMALAIVKHMTDEQYSRMVANYMIGYRVAAEDLECGHIVPATDGYSNGVTASFNSIATPDAFWDFLNAGAVFCTNPVNWKIDSTPADFEYEGQTLTAHVDTELNSLIIEGIDIEEYRFEPLEKYCKPGNLHHWDIKFFRPLLRRDALNRAYGK